MKCSRSVPLFSYREFSQTWTVRRRRSAVGLELRQPRRLQAMLDCPDEPLGASALLVSKLGALDLMVDFANYSIVEIRGF